MDSYDIDKCYDLADGDYWTWYRQICICPDPFQYALCSSCIKSVVMKEEQAILFVKKIETDLRDE